MVLTTPSRTALKKIRQRLAEELRGADPIEVIGTLTQSSVASITVAVIRCVTDLLLCVGLRDGGCGCGE